MAILSPVIYLFAIKSDLAPKVMTSTMYGRCSPIGPLALNPVPGVCTDNLLETIQPSGLVIYLILIACITTGIILVGAHILRKLNSRRPARALTHKEKVAIRILAVIIDMTLLCTLFYSAFYWNAETYSNSGKCSLADSFTVCYSSQYNMPLIYWSTLSAILLVVVIAYSYLLTRIKK